MHTSPPSSPPPSPLSSAPASPSEPIYQSALDLLSCFTAFQVSNPAAATLSEEREFISLELLRHAHRSASNSGTKVFRTARVRRSDYEKRPKEECEIIASVERERRRRDRRRRSRSANTDVVPPLGMMSDGKTVRAAMTEEM